MITIKDESQLAGVADQIIEKKAAVIALEGPLGAGKTALTKVLMKKLGVLEPIVSPTYVLHIPHETIDHLDVYRLENQDEFRRLYVEEMLKEKHMVIIEWADKFETQIKGLGKGVWVKIGYGKNESEREIELTEFGG